MKGPQISYNFMKITKNSHIDLCKAYLLSELTRSLGIAGGLGWVFNQNALGQRSTFLTFDLLIKKNATFHALLTASMISSTVFIFLPIVIVVAYIHTILEYSETTCIKRPLCDVPKPLHNIFWPVFKDHLSTKALAWSFDRGFMQHSSFKSNEI